MITITLNKIRKHSPCTDGWKKLLKSKEGVDYNKSFPLTDVIDNNDLEDTLWCLRCLPEHDSLWRKYAVWCARQVEHLLVDQRSKEALNVAWRHSNGDVSDEELDAARDAAWVAVEAAVGDAAEDAAWAAARVATGAAAGVAAWAATGVAAWAAARAATGAATGASTGASAWVATWGETKAKQEDKLREILKTGKWV